MVNLNRKTTWVGTCFNLSRFFAKTSWVGFNCSPPKKNRRTKVRTASSVALHGGSMIQWLSITWHDAPYLCDTYIYPIHFVGMVWAHMHIENRAYHKRLISRKNLQISPCLTNGCPYLPHPPTVIGWSNQLKSVKIHLIPRVLTGIMDQNYLHSWV